MRIFKFSLLALIGILGILVGIISTVGISQYGQVGPVGDPTDNWNTVPGCEFITGDCCPGDVISIANCNDRDLCTADYCTVSGTVGSCVNIPLPDPNCTNGGPGPDPDPDPDPDPESSSASISSQNSSGQASSLQGSSIQASSQPRSSTQSSSDSDNNACDACAQQLCDKCQAYDQGCYAREVDDRTLTECFAGPRSGWSFCCGDNGGGDDGGDGGTGGGQSECGNGDKEDEEECDDGNTNNTDGCTNDCKLPSCGDGSKQYGEWCDDGENNSDTEPDACREDCTPAGCGDGVLDSPELCDCGLGDGVSPQYCNTTNAKTPYGDDTEVRCWSSSCNLSHYCGNGIVERDGLDGQRYTADDEECDDGNRDNGDECSSTCKLVNTECGNGKVDAGEDCDLGSKCMVSGDSCNDCHASYRQTCCGESDRCVVQSEKGGNWGDIYCTSRCKYEEVLCGNGTIDTDIPGGTPDEECDPGAAHLGEGSAQCREWCYLPLCGDGIVDNSNNQTNGYQTLDGFEEECDNGSKCVGIRSPDGEIYEGMDCYHIWLKGGSIDKVSNYACEAYGGTCEPQSGDGCDDQCKNEGQSHSSASNVLSANSSSDGGGGGGESCGNGIREGSEICDEGINNSDDTEATCRTDCTPGTCGNGQIETGHGEECDCGPIDTTNCITVNSEGIGILCRLSCTGDYCGDGDLYSKGIDNQYRTMDDEVCDLGEQNSDDPNAQCRTDCKPKRCGDGIVDSGEECDIGEMRCDDGSLCAVLDDDITRWKDTCIWNPVVPSNQGSCKPIETNDCDSNCKAKDPSQSSSSSSSSSSDDDDGTSSSSSSFGFSSNKTGPFHTICNDNSCELVAGNGRNECVLSLGCGTESHLECNNNSCKQIAGPGAHQCHPQIGCGVHAACINYSCKTLPGPGKNSCVLDSDCEHIDAICRNGILEADEECEAAIECVSALRICDIQTCTCPLKPKSSSSSSFSSSLPSSLLSSSSFYSSFSTIIAASSSEDFLALIDDIRNKNTEYEDVILRETLVAAASFCGNGTLEVSEECDDRNRREGDGCNSTCLLEIGICGDGVVQSLLGEQCENSTHDKELSYQCSKCHFLSLTCGDENVDAGEECDDGKRNSSSPDALCRPNCSLSRCGDNVLDAVETCDDGNRLNNDGCDRYCRIEHEYEDDEYEQETQVANTLPYSQLPTPYSRNVNFPQYPSYQQMPYQLPMAQLQPLIQAQGPIGDTGPAAVAVIGAGAAAGLSWIRRKRK